MKPSVFQYLFNFILFLILLFPFYRVYANNNSIIRPLKFTQKQTFLYGITLLSLSVFGFSDFDFWGCWMGFQQYKKYGDTGVYEPIYQWLTDLISSYFIWRFMIWGVAVFLMIKTINRLRVNYSATYIFITLLYVLSFYKLRNILGFSVMFWGVSLIIQPYKGKRFLSILVGIVYIVLSLWCHRTMIISVALLISCFFNFSKTKMSILLIAWPFLVTAITILLNNFVSGLIILGGDDVELNKRAMIYASSEGMVYTANGIIGLILKNSVILIPLAYMTKKIIYERVQIPNIIKYLYRYWFVSFYIAYLFAFQTASDWIYIRIATMGYFPMCVVLGWFWANHKRTRGQKVILILGMITYIFTTAYMVYDMGLISRFSDYQF